MKDEVLCQCNLLYNPCSIPIAACEEACEFKLFAKGEFEDALEVGCRRGIPDSVEHLIGPLLGVTEPNPHSACPVVYSSHKLDLP
jgi:hypothetical protein